tara:strand:+ start:678 stop:1307 length:630 start_codon:yes stop_codon:yes gene_type:complete
MTEELAFWKGDFGNDYTNRNVPSRQSEIGRFRLWGCILQYIAKNRLNSVLEVGCNIGQNLKTLSFLLDSALYGIEPNQEAVKQSHTFLKDVNTSIIEGDVFSLPFEDGEIDLVFTSGVLIHIDPEHLVQATREIVRVAKRYVVAIEYFSPSFESVNYRGNSGKLYKGDFGSMYLDNHGLQPLAEGFAWKRTSGLDDLTWWIMEKSDSAG